MWSLAGATAAGLCRGHFPVVCTLRPRPAGLAERRLAVLVVGQRDRFYPWTTLRHVVAPAAAAGLEVDYYALLSLRAAPNLAWRSYWLRPAANPEVANLTPTALSDHVARRARISNASRAFFFFLPRDVRLEDPPRAGDPHWRRWLGRGSGDHQGLPLSLRRLKKIELLWNQTAVAQAAAGGPVGGYQHVLLVRDDAHWLRDVHMAHFPDPLAVYSRRRGQLCQDSDTPGMPNDGAFVVGGRVAAEFLPVYSEYLHNPSAELDAVANVEHFFVVLARLKGIRWEMVPHHQLPFVEALHMHQPEWWSKPRMCLRHLFRGSLAHPTGSCVHHTLVRHPLCHAFPLM